MNPISEGAARYPENAPATDNQIRLIQSLKEERIVPNEVLFLNRALWNNGAFNARVASTFIDVLKNCPPRDSIATSGSTNKDSLVGVHKVGDQIIKVQRAKESPGRLYAKVLTEELGGNKWSFRHLPGGMRMVNANTKISLEDAKYFGRLTGTCCICGRVLTNPVSVEAGIGPVCSGGL